LGALAQQAARQPLDELVQQRLLDRIGMNDTGFWVRRGGSDRLAVYYGVDDAGKLTPRPPMALSNYTSRGTFFSAGGGLVSTVGDYLRFAQMLLNGGTLDGVRVLAPATVAAMGTNALTEAQGGEVNWYDFNPAASYRGYGWGLAIGVRQADRPHAVPGSVGDLIWYGLANTYFFVDPVEQLVAVVMSQYVGPEASELDFRMRRGVYGALSDRVAVNQAASGGIRAGLAIE
jgi:CubicO group peptidase (beta-lactamase class C family)